MSPAQQCGSPCEDRGNFRDTFAAPSPHIPREKSRLLLLTYGFEYGAKKYALKLFSDINGREKLLLHICCAPDASYGAPALNEFFDVCGYFFNPNIQPEDELQKRLQAAHDLAEKLRFPMLAEGGAQSEWEEAVKGLENEPERGRRCEICIRLRLLKTAEKAAQLGMPVFGTVLTVSPKKDAAMVNRAGAEVEKITGVRFLAADLKKQDGYLKSIRACKELGVYRQRYCGCRFSLKARD